MAGEIGNLSIEALVEDLAHLIWLVEEAIKQGEEDEQDTAYWKGLLSRLKNSSYKMK
ncbi:MAG TPA: hypothetical protein VN426_12980 [Syntrophomonadaceae bacterium]|nr:hypothetical protein [Syntrophomonadaceae bacterium]